MKKEEGGKLGGDDKCYLNCRLYKLCNYIVFIVYV